MDHEDPSERFKVTLKTIAASTVFCTCVHLVVTPLWRHTIGRQRYMTFKRREQIYLAEKTVSSINAAVTGGFALYAVASGQFTGDVVYSYTKAMHCALGFCAGYSIYDTATMALGAHEPLIMWIHHLLGLAGTGAMLYYRRLAFFPVIFLISELTVLPFNVIWYLSKFQVPRTSLAMRVALFIRAIAFLTLRAPVGVFALWYANAQTNGGLGELYRRIVERGEVASGLAAAAAFNTFAFTIMNFIWTAQAIRVSMGSKKKAD